MECKHFFKTVWKTYVTRQALFLALCVLVVASSATSFAFNSYSSAFKAWFNMTQSEVETVASVTFVSAAVNLPAGMFYDTYGILPAMLLSLVIYTGGWGFVWAASTHPAVFSSETWIICIFMVVAGHGRTYGFVTGITASVSAVSQSRRSLMLVFVETMFDTGTLIYVFIYQTFFINGDELDVGNHLLDKFFIFVVAWIFIVNVVGTVGMSRYERTLMDHKDAQLTSAASETLPDVFQQDRRLDYNETTQEIELTELESKNKKHKNEYNEIMPNAQNREDVETVQKNTGFIATAIDVRKQISAAKSVEKTRLIESQKKTSCCRDSALTTLNYQLIMWATAIPTAVAAFLAFNVLFITRSLSLSQHDYYLVVFHRAFVVCGRLGFGLPAALIKGHRFVGEAFIIVSNLLVLFLQVALVVCGSYSPVIFVVVLGTAVSHGALYVLGPMLVAEYFGLHKFGTNMSLITSIVPIMTTIIQMIFAKLYEAEIQPGGGHYCYGINCISGSVFINVTLCSISTVLSVIMLVRKLKHNRVLNW